jgi:stringent starvation protein B
MSPTQPLPPKKEVALALLERSSVYIHLDPRQTAVVVPPWFKKQPQLVLQVGLNMPVPIADLRLDDDGMSCTLSFSRTPFFCVVPWSSVFAMMGDDNRGMVWPDDVPVEVARQAQGRASESPARKEPPKVGPAREPKAEAAAKPKRARKRPSLTAVPDGEEAPLPASAKPSKPAAEPVAPAAARPAAAPAVRPSVGAGAGATRKKRELPPYLRVVK